jgi:serine/threonine-protein kinase
MLGAVVLQRADAAVLEPDGSVSVCSFWRGAEVTGELRVDADTGTAAVTRLAVLAGLDPLVASDSPEGASNVARARVRRAAEVAELLVSVSASSRGLHGEVRALALNGRAARPPSGGTLKRCGQCGAFYASGHEACERDGAALVDVEDRPEVGGTIGSYVLASRLGEGTGGTVFAAEHALLGRAVALKLMSRALVDNPELARRFLAEARAACRLVHPNVIQVTDYGVMRDGHPYIVMERLVGEPLDVRLARAGALAPLVALRIVREIALALGASHEAGIAHNDLKPSNVVMLEGGTDATPRLKVIDFGAASRVGTAEDLLFGTPGYMAPERIVGAPSDGRADIYSLGMVLYELIEGFAPFEELPQEALLLAHLRGPLPPLRSPSGPVPPLLARLFDRAVAKSADERYQSAGEMVAQIDRVIEVLAEGGPRRWFP